MHCQLQQQYLPPEKVEIQVLQKHPVYVAVSQCQVFVTRQVFRCGIDSLSYGQHTLYYKKAFHPNMQDCMMMVKDKLSYMDNQKIELILNNTVNINYHSQGWVDPAGHCEGKTFTRDGVNYAKTVESTSVEITISKFLAKFYEDTGKIIMKTIACNEEDLYCTDSSLGTFAWEHRAATCANQHSQLYHGEALLYKSYEKIYPSFLVVSDKKSGSHAGIYFIYISII